MEGGARYDAELIDVRSLDACWESATCNEHWWYYLENGDADTQPTTPLAEEQGVL